MAKSKWVSPPAACCSGLRLSTRIMWNGEGSQASHGYYPAYDVYGCASCGPSLEPCVYEDKFVYCPYCGQRF